MKRIPVYKFFKHKYGDELLVDVVDYDDMRSPLRRTPVCSYTFYALTLVFEADEQVALNGQGRQLGKGDLVCAIPGEVWTYYGDITLRALNLVFEKEFLLSFFNDPHFLDRFPYFAADRPSPFLRLDDAAFDRIHALYREMQQEIGRRPDIDQHILRAMLYETLMLLSRQPFAEAAQTEVMQRSLADIPMSRYVDDFRQLVSKHFREEHGTEFYADRLCITPNYLNKMVRQTLGKSAKTYILDQILGEACRLLKYTTLSVNDIASELHFDTATYFVRIFKKYTEMTPLEYRQKQSPEK